MNTFPLIFSLSTVIIHQFHSYTKILTLISLIPTLIPRIPIIPLIPFPDSPFRHLQIALHCCYGEYVTTNYKT